jgi:hypothetical protein
MTLKIGYFPLSDNLSHPGDRRRIAYWAKKNSHELIINPSSKVDVVVMSERANFGRIMPSFHETPVILDLVDAYLEKENVAKDFIRGFSKIAIGDLRSRPRSFSAIIRDVCVNSHAVICSSPEQLESLKSYNKNIHVILDSHDEFEFRSYENYKHGESSNLLWEGMPFTLDGFRQISEALLKFMDREQLHLNLLTDLKFHKFLGKFRESDTQDLLSKIFFKQVSRINLQQWSIMNLQAASQKAILGVLPVDINNPIQFLKPENRLLIMWRLGLPAVVANTPAYSRVSDAVGINIIPKSYDDWVDLMSYMIKDPEYARFTLQEGQKYLNEYHNYDTFDSAWKHAIGSVL